MIEVVIIDDEVAQRESLNKKLSEKYPELHIAALCASAEEGMMAIARYSPHLVFLDVEMPGMSGFELLESLREIRFSVIFTTSHAAYAVRAFRVAAVDFLLKPYPDEDLQAAIEKFIENKTQSENLHISTLIANRRDESNSKIALPTSNGYIFVKLQDVIRLESQNTYTTFFMKDKNQIVVSRTLKECDEMLCESGFIRVHQSHMINLAHIRKFVRGEGGTVEMDDGSSVEVSRRKKDEFLEALKRL